MGEGKIKICPEGAINLIRGIVKQAIRDFLNTPPESRLHLESEHFFLHPGFEKLTGMDGKRLLQVLDREYEKTKRGKKK